MTRTFEVVDSSITLTAITVKMGCDLLVSVFGGAQPHIGSASVSVPRPSLANPEKVSSTTSTINLVGHKDNAVGDMMSSHLSAALNTNVVVVCGIHNNHIKAEEIAYILVLCEDLATQISQFYLKHNSMLPTYMLSDQKQYLNWQQPMLNLIGGLSHD